MKSIRIHATVPLLLLTLLGGCAQTPRLDREFGDAVKAARLAQTINPLPPATTAVNGIDGEAAKSAYDAYQKSFKAPQPQAGALSVGVGR